RPAVCSCARRQNQRGQESSARRGAGIASPREAAFASAPPPLREGAVMANRVGNDDRGFGAAGGTGGTSDRERQRDVINEPARNSGGSLSASNSGNASSNGGGRKSARGFASMDQGKQKEIASKGGRAAHAKGTAHEF